MSSFVHAPLLWGLLLVGLPVLIHLINLWRQRRVRWAAMEFLLKSQRKNRRWILLKQLLLLLARMTAVAALVLTLAQPVIQDEWAGLLGGGVIHHVVLLDDSFSMADTWEGSSAFDRAKRAVSRLVESLNDGGAAQKFTLARYSEVASKREGTQPEVFQESVVEQFVSQLLERLNRLEPSELSTDTSAALAGLRSILSDSAADETRLIYLVSDFRERDWRDSRDLVASVRELDESGARLWFVDCVDRARENLTLSKLASASGSMAADVPFVMEVAVTNHGDALAENVPIRLSEDGQARVAAVIEEVPAGKTVSRTFPVQFAAAGWHTVRAELEADAVATDNRRDSAVWVAGELPVLIIADGDGTMASGVDDAYFLTTALAPGGAAETGLRPRVEPPRALATLDLGEFTAIYLLDVPRLDEPEARALEEYVQGGGGVAFFLGPSINASAYDATLHRGGSGLFPVPLGKPTELFVDRLERKADLSFADHPLFRVFSGERNSFLEAVAVQKYYGLPPGWSPSESGSQVIARLRNGAPFAMEGHLGPGRVLTFLTTLGPRWNNWARGNPSFVVTMHEIQNYLSAPRARGREELVGTPLRLRLPPREYDRNLSLVLPGKAATEGVEVTASLDQEELSADWTDTAKSGIYEVRLRKATGAEETRLIAYHVSPEEGNLRLADRADLAEQFEGANVIWESADRFRQGAVDLAGFNLGQSLLVLLIVVLILEQILAYVASYHLQPSKEGPR